MFDIGSRTGLHFGDGNRPATIIYNDGAIAIAGTQYEVGDRNGYEWEHAEFVALTCPECLSTAAAMENILWPSAMSLPARWYRWVSRQILLWWA